MVHIDMSSNHQIRSFFGHVGAKNLVYIIALPLLPAQIALPPTFSPLVMLWKVEPPLPGLRTCLLQSENECLSSEVPSLAPNAMDAGNV